MYSYKNVVLIVVFTWARDCVHVNRLRNLYEAHFKRVIFYSHTAENASKEQIADGVHYMDIRNGWNVIRIFDHFASTYAHEIHTLDGVFYSMDDNIINVNILKFYSPSKILHLFSNPAWTSMVPGHPDNHNEMMDVDTHNGWHWSGKHINSFKELLKDPEFNVEKYGSKCRGQLGDYFYLPIRYVRETFKLFTLFEKYDLMLEIAIPTAIRMIEPNEENYHNFKTIELWGEEYRSALLHKELVYDIFIRQLMLFVHPIKFNHNPEALEWIEDIFSKPRQNDKCVVITTINGMTEAIRKHINSDYDVIVVADKKTPNTFRLQSPETYYEKTEEVKYTLREKRCIFMDVTLQNSLFDRLSKLIPFNHYGRKNLGYLYAILQRYTVIYETDDDNIPNDNFDIFANAVELEDTKHTWINIFKYFTNNAHIWPRGYPLSLVKSKPEFKTSETSIVPSIVIGLVEGDPDVDAIFRLTQIGDIEWEKNKAVVVSNKNICVFNTQNTFWTDSSIFITMILPCSVTFRYCDILKGIVTNIVLKWTNKRIMYTSPNVIQIRNDHNLIKDLESEQPMYISNEVILNFIEDGITCEDDIKTILRKIYNNLFVKKIVQQVDIDILEEWLQYF